MNQAKSWSTSIVFTVFPWILEVNASKEEDKIVLQRSTVGFKLSREQQGLLILQDDKAPEKPIETTAESSFMSFLASGASFLGGEAGKQATGPAPHKNQMKDCFESLL